MGSKVHYLHSLFSSASFIAHHIIIFPLPYLFYVTSGLAIGIGTQPLQLPHFLISLGILALIISTYARLIRISLFITALLLGTFLYTHQVHQWHIQSSQCIHGDYQGTVKALQESRGLPWGCTLIFHAQEKKTPHNDWSPCNLTLALSLPYMPPIRIGDTIQISNIAPHAGRSDPHLVQEGIHAWAYPKKFTFQLMRRPSWSLSRWVDHLRKKTASSCAYKLSGSARNLFDGIFLGKSSSRHIMLRETCSRWGLIHFLARAGLHLMIMVILLGLFMQLIPLPYVIKHLFMVGILFIYALLSWQSISFTRALLTLLIYKVGVLTDTPLHNLHVWSVVTLLVLLHNPAQLFALDFQLSFGLTGALLWTNALQRIRNQLS